VGTAVKVFKIRDQRSWS